jgi:ABC-type glycerol-3-phosphate transport system permease component
VSTVALTQSLGRRWPRTRHPKHLGSYVVLIVIGLICVVPMLWALSASLHTNNNVYLEPFTWIPSPAHFGNYSAGWSQTNFGAAMLRSFGIALVIAVTSVVFGLMCAYGISHFRFRGRRLIFVATVAVLLVPFPSIMVPVFIMTRKLNLVNSYTGVILPGILSPLGVFLMRQYLLRLPDEMVQAARVDGAGEFSIFWRVVVPLSWPVMAAVGVLTFVASWNNLLWPLIVLSSPNHFTVPLALEQFNSVNSTDYVGMLSMSLVAIAPVVVMFIITRKRLIDSVMLSGGGLAGT